VAVGPDIGEVAGGWQPGLAVGSGVAIQQGSGR
jgi:hypothetical protein